MTRETFTKGMTLIKQTFDRDINLVIAWQILNSLDDEPFTRAILFIVGDLCEIYPGTNLIAMIKQKTNEFKSKIIREENEGQKSIEYKWPTKEESEEFLRQLKDAVK